MINIETILQNTSLNISREKKHDKGYKYYKNLGLSFQGCDAKKTLKEIINIAKIQNCSFYLKIKLIDEDIQHICFVL
jgi:hypothetical protein